MVALSDVVLKLHDVRTVVLRPSELVDRDEGRRRRRAEDGGSQQGERSEDSSEEMHRCRWTRKRRLREPSENHCEEGWSESDPTVNLLYEKEHLCKACELVLLKLPSERRT